MLLTYADCLFYKVTMNEYGSPPILTEFFEVVKRLANTPPEQEAAAYYKFLDTYGTHYPVEVTYGARFGHKLFFRKDELDLTTEEEKELTSELSVGRDKYMLSAKASAQISISRAVSKLREISNYSIFSIGAKPPDEGGTGREGDEFAGGQSWAEEVGQDEKKQAAPIKYKLESIDRLFRPSRFHGVPITKEVLDLLKTKTRKYLDTYCLELLKRGVTRYCHEVGE